MRRSLIVLGLLLLAASPVAAQTNTPTPTRTPTATLPTPSTPRPAETIVPRECGTGIPCGPIPWLLPVLPTLASPTPFPTVVIQASPNPTDTPGPTPTPSITPIPSPTFAPTEDGFSVGDIEDAVSTLSAIMEQTSEPISGVDMETGSVTIGDGITTVFGYIRGISDLDLGVLDPLIAALIFGLGFILLLKSFSFTLPLIGMVFGFLRKVVQLVLDFIPG